MDPITREHWEERRAQAHLLMTERTGKPSVLIEVSAQHQLRDGIQPGPEFEARLLQGRQLYLQARNDGKAAEIIVTGSRHREGEVADKVPLWEAGKTFLIAQGIPETDIRGEDLMNRYKGGDEPWPGVFNSADEAYVASSYFKETPDFGEMHTIVGPAQLHRKMLHYLWMGVLPLAWSVPLSVVYHDYLKEAWDFLPFVLTQDPDHQQPGSLAARHSRERRVP